MKPIGITVAQIKFLISFERSAPDPELLFQGLSLAIQEEILIFKALVIE